METNKTEISGQKVDLKFGTYVELRGISGGHTLWWTKKVDVIVSYRENNFIGTSLESLVVLKTLI